jgi:hypothetical protein
MIQTLCGVQRRKLRKLSVLMGGGEYLYIQMVLTGGVWGWMGAGRNLIEGVILRQRHGSVRLKRSSEGQQAWSANISSFQAQFSMTLLQAVRQLMFL